MPTSGGQGNPDWTREEMILAMDLLVRCDMEPPSKADPAVLELSDLLRDAAIHPPDARNAVFRNPAGVARTIAVLRSSETADKASRIQREVWAEFHDKPDRLAEAAARIRADLELLEQTPLPEADEDGVYQENTVRMRAHSRRERARGLRDKVIARARRRHGSLRCEACGCEERTGLGRIAAAEFEAHHREPLAGSDGVRTTRVGDFAILCASCHRLIHALMRAEDRTVAIEEFRTRLEI